MLAKGAGFGLAALLALAGGAVAVEGLVCVSVAEDVSCTGVAASVTGNSEALVAASGTGAAGGETCVGDFIVLCDLAGVSATGDASGIVAATLLGDSEGGNAVSGTGDSAGLYAVSLTGDASAAGCILKIGGVGSVCEPGAVSGTGDASGAIAVSATGHASGTVAVSGCDLVAEAWLDPA